MTFTRSPSSLFSYNKFYGVDVVVYCEGGASITMDLVLSGAGGEGTPDTFYWSQFLGMISSGKTFHVKSVGSKPNLLLIAEQVINSDVKTASVCMDRDYADINGGSICHSRVVYTQGYSWENDVLNLEIVKDFLMDYIGAGTEYENAAQNLTSAYMEVDKELCTPIKCDAARIKSGFSGIFNRQKPNCHIDFSSEPVLKIPEIFSKCGGIDVNGMGHLNIQPVKQCFGHLFAIYIYHKAVYFIRQVFKSFKISYEHFIRNVTSKTFKLARVEGDMHNYVMSCQGAL